MENNGEQLIGKVIHYYGKIGVAIVALQDSLKVGDTVRFAGNMEEFEEVIGSMEVERQKISEAHAGDEVGVKVGKKVKEGTQVYRISA